MHKDEWELLESSDERLIDWKKQLKRIGQVELSHGVVPEYSSDNTDFAVLPTFCIQTCREMGCLQSTGLNLSTFPQRYIASISQWTKIGCPRSVHGRCQRLYISIMFPVRFSWELFPAASTTSRSFESFASCLFCLRFSWELLPAASAAVLFWNPLGGTNFLSAMMIKEK